MKTQFNQFVLFAQKIDRRHIQLAFGLLALVMLVLGAAAPDDGGFVSH
jgi:hypothetical protein